MAAPAPPGAARIVVVEDDVVIQALLDTLLSEAGYTVLPWTHGAGADTFIHEVQPDLWSSLTCGWSILRRAAGC
jgi:CheY-like chemotaxis protein